MRRAVHDLADLAHGHVAHLVVDHAGFDIQHGAAGRAGLAQLVVGAEHGRQRGDLGLAVQVPQTDPGQAAGDLLHHLHRHDGGAVVALGQPGKIGLVEQRRAQQRDPHRGRREEAGDAVRRHHGQQIVGRGLGGDVVGGADVDGRAKEHVELRAVVERQGVQGHVVLGDLGVDAAAHVLPQHGVVRQHGALGAGFGAAGVDDLRQVGALQRRFRQGGGAGGQLVEAGHAGHWLARVFRRQPDEVLHLRVQRGGGAGQIGQTGIGGQGPGTGVAQDVGHFVGLEHEVDRHQHRAQPRQREAQRREAVRVARQHGHLVAAGDAALRQPGRQAADQGIELGIGPARVAAGNGQLGGQALGGAAQQIADGLAADGGWQGAHDLSPVALLLIAVCARCAWARRQKRPRNPVRAGSACRGSAGAWGRAGRARARCGADRPGR